MKNQLVTKLNFHTSLPPTKSNTITIECLLWKFIFRQSLWCGLLKCLHQYCSFSWLCDKKWMPLINFAVLKKSVVTYTHKKITILLVTITWPKGRWLNGVIRFLSLTLLSRLSKFFGFLFRHHDTNRRVEWLSQRS